MSTVINYTDYGKSLGINEDDFMSFAYDQKFKTLLDQSLTDDEWDRLFLVSDAMGPQPLDIKRIGSWDYKNFQDLVSDVEPIRILAVEVSKSNTVNTLYFVLDTHGEPAKERVQLILNHSTSFPFPTKILDILNENDVTIG